MSKKLPIFYSALLLTGVNLLLRLGGTGFQVFLSGRIGAGGIGLLQLVLSVGSLAMTASMAGVRTAAMYLTAEELGKKRPENVVWVLSGCFTYSILCSCTVSALLYTLAPFLAQHWIGDMQAVDAVRTYAAFLPAVCLSGVMTGYFTAANRIGTLAAVEIIEQLICLAITVLLLVFQVGDDRGMACQAVIFGSGSSAIVTLVILVILRVKEHPARGRRIPIRSRLLQTAVPLAGADMLRSGISTTENLMVPKRLALYPGAADPMATFGTVCGMVFPVLMFPACILFGLAELLIPELARCAAAGSQKRIRYLVRKSLRVALLYGFGFSAAMFLLAEPLCQALYHSSEAGEQLRLYSLLIPILYCDAITDAMTKGLGQQKACVRYNIITSSMDVLLLFLLLPRYGMIGYFFSFLVTHLINFALSLRRLILISKVKLRLITPLLAGLCTIVALFMGEKINTPAISAGVCITLWISLLFLLGVVSRADIVWIKGLMKRRSL